MGYQGQPCRAEEYHSTRSYSGCDGKTDEGRTGKREKILRAEGEKEYQIKVAQGEQEAKVLRAEADKKAAILHAEAEKEATILRGEAIKEQKIRIADGEARSIEVVQQALADSLVQLNKANPNASVLQLKALEAFQKAADGKATKIIIPSEIQGLAGLAAGLKGIVESDQPTESSETVAQVAKNGTTISQDAP